MVSVISSNQTYSRSGMAIAGRGARACDMCGKERARWYCAADEAYLCERCDASVHSANSVARKHDRVKLGPNGAPMKLKPSNHHHHHSSGHTNKIRKTAAGNKLSSNHNIRMDCDHEIHDESLPLLLLEGGAANVSLSQQVPKVEDEEEEQAKEEQVVCQDQGDIMSSMGSRRWWRSSRKRARTPRGKCCTPVTPSNLILSNHPHPTNIEHDHDPYKTCGNPILNTMVKEEKDIIDQDQDSILLFDSLLSCDDDCMDKFGHDYPPLCYKEDPFTLSHGAYNTCFTTSDQSMSHHEVPTYEPLLQELIDDVNHHGDLMEKILSPSCSTSPSFCITNASCCHVNDNPDIHAPPSLELSPTHDTCDNNSGEGLSGISSSNLETNSFRGCDFIDDGSLSINEDSEIDTFDMMDLCSINANLDDDQLNGSDIQEDFPGVEMWREAYGEDQMARNGNVIFEGNPFNGKGERALVEIGSCVKMEELMDGEVELPQPLPSRKVLSLRLDYEEVLNAWSDRGSLWMDGQRPQIVPDICLFGYGNVEQYSGAMVMVDKSNCDNNGGASQVGQVPMLFTDSGREARVSRYREKRRTRLFSKKIRYEVRKLNAERRPRMKGRFVKRTTIAAM